jgi:Undecaprenyl-phosphate galactose phosphotransferase WbaP
LTLLTNPQPAATLMQTPTAESEIGWIDYAPFICALVLLAADCLAMVATAVIVGWCTAWLWPKLGALFPPGSTSTRFDLGALFATIVLYFAVKGRYREPIPFWTEARMVVCTSLCAVGAGALFWLSATGVPPSTPAFMVLLVFPVLAIIANRLAKRTLAFAGLWSLPVVVIGNGPCAAEVALESDRSLGYRFVGRVDPDTVLTVPTENRLWSLLNHYNARRLFIMVDGERQRQLIECALRERVPFALMPPYVFPAFPFEPRSFFSHDIVLLSFRHGLSRPVARVTKVAFDLLIAVFLLIVTSPLFVALMIISRLDGGPTFFAHRRVGAHGERFHCLKFRTMVVDADQALARAIARDPALAAEWATTRKLIDDPRVTGVGRFLRRTSLDELPQLINVLRLEMSLVGPRPIVESEIPLYGEDIAQYYATRPGLTGLWQVSGRSNISYAKRVRLDVWYVNNWTIWHDIVVLLKTVPAVLGRQGAR